MNPNLRYLNEAAIHSHIPIYDSGISQIYLSYNGMFLIHVMYNHMTIITNNYLYSPYIIHI